MPLKDSLTGLEKDLNKGVAMLKLLKDDQEKTGLAYEVRMPKEEWDQVVEQRKTDKFEAFKLGFGCGVGFSLFCIILVWL